MSQQCIEICNQICNNKYGGTNMSKDLKQINKSKGKSGFTLAEVFSVHPKDSRKHAFTLAEVFSVHPKDIRKHAFTLAEVLVTLGIIGVVAAMTLPTLIQKHQKKVWVTALKKNYTMINDGFRQMMAADGVDRFEDTEFYTEYVKALSTGTSVDDVCTTFMPKYFKTLKFTPLTDLSDMPTSNKLYSNDVCDKWLKQGLVWYVLSDIQGRNRCFILKQHFTNLTNGITVQIGIFPNYPEFADSKGKIKHEIGEVTIDVNGLAGPNQYGRDAFAFVLAQDGYLYPFGGKDFSEYAALKSKTEANTKYWQTDTSGYHTCQKAEGNIGSTGFGCAARIIENGWVMDY